MKIPKPTPVDRPVRTVDLATFLAESETPFMHQRQQSMAVLWREVPVFRFRMPLVIESRGNARGHSRWQAKGTKTQRKAGFIIGRAMLTALHDRRPVGAEFIVVRLVRVAPYPVDSDNIATCLKPVRDGIADAFGINDRDPRIRYEPDQIKGPAALEAYLYARGSE